MGTNGCDDGSLAKSSSSESVEEVVEAKIMVPDVPTPVGGSPGVQDTMASSPPLPESIKKREVSWNDSVVDKTPLPASIPSTNTKAQDPPWTDASETVASGPPRSERITVADTMMPAMPRTVVGEWIASGPPRPEPVHKRGVSWDVNVVDKTSVPASIPATNTKAQDPPLEATSETVSSLIELFKTGDPAVTGKVDKGHDDPFDSLSKSDSDLMHSLDESDPLRPGANTGETVLPGVPMDTIQHDFVVKSVEQHAPAPRSPRSRADSRDTRSSQTQPARARLGSRDSTVSSASRRSLMRQKTERSMASSRAIQAATRHRRKNTVEQDLFGLTCALSEMKRDEREYYREPEEKQMEAVTGAYASDRLDVTAKMLMRRMASTRDLKPALPTEIETNEEASNPAPGSPPTAPNAPVGNNKWGIENMNLGQGSERTDDKNDLPDIEEGSRTSPSEMAADDFQIGLSDHKEGETGDGKRPRFSLFRRRKQMPNPFRHLPYAENIRQEWDLFNQFLKPRKGDMWSRGRYIVLFLWLPLIGISAFLFHFKKFDNPPTGSCNSAGGYDRDNASISWWLLFIFRETVLVCLARLTEVLIIDFLALSTRAILRTCGPMVTLLIVQSKGWPFVTFFWGLYNYALVTGDRRISHHWLFWQNFWGLLNTCNPSGSITSEEWFLRIVHVATGVGAAVAVKRLLISVMLGRKTFAVFSQPLAKLMKKMLQVSEVASLARDIEKRQWVRISKGMAMMSSRRNFTTDGLKNLISSAQAEDLEDKSSLNISAEDEDHDEDEDMDRVIDPEDVDPYTGSLNSTQKARIRELLGSWEDPARGAAVTDEITIGAVFQFRRALAHMDTDFPFTGSFGLADTRYSCIASAQDVYDRLMLKGDTIEGKLHFDVIASLAVQRNGELDQEECKDFIRTFRPDRDGSITMVDFVRSIDTVYKELRMLRATVASSSKIDRAIEKIFNVFFYLCVICIILARTGHDPLALFLSLSSLIVGFAFMIGSASAKYFEGLLFIFIQRPYGIGDRINVSNSESESSFAGSQGWIVEDVNLYTTTICLAGTNERATISNGTLAKSRIINCARSPKGIIFITMKFSVDTPYKSIEVFKGGVEKFVKSRPREWLSILGFRANAVHADLGHIEYGIVVQHRTSWQNIGDILDSKQTLNQFCLELAKRLNMRYVSPPLPVDLRISPSQMGQLNLNLDSQACNDGQLKSSVLTMGSFVSETSPAVKAVTAMFDGK